MCIGIEPREKQRQVGLFMAEDANRLEAYGGVFSTLHPKTWEEVKTMARSKLPRLGFSILPSVEYIGLDKVIEQIGKKKVLEKLDVDDILANLAPAKRRELKRRLQAESASRP
jgi:hypothetical protein